MTSLIDYIDLYNEYKTAEGTLNNNKVELKNNLKSLLNSYFTNTTYTIEYISADSVVLFMDTLDNNIIQAFEDLTEDNITYTVGSDTKYDDPVFRVELIPETVEEESEP